MITQILIDHNGNPKFILQPETPLEIAALSALKGATIKADTAADGITILGKTIPHAVIISIDDKK